ncbi:MAG: hypothetical protein K2X27_25205 [Candidatus Obscuribacterales bacterium]|nr:hypothetical protein [Candidatus Obscuribacterales bacterium]
MSEDHIVIIGCCIMGLIAHGARSQLWLEWVLRVTYGLFLFGEFLNIAVGSQEEPWSHAILVGCTAASGLLLFKPGRKLFSILFTFINQIVAGRVFLAAFGKLQLNPAAPLAVGSEAMAAKANTLNSSATEKKDSEEVEQAEDRAEAETGLSSEAAPDSLQANSENSESAQISSSRTAEASSSTQTEASRSAPNQETPTGPQKVSILQAFFVERIFVPESIPHMNGLWIYLTTMLFLLTHMEMQTGFQMPSIMIPLPVTMDQLFSYNFLGLIMLAFCGCGIFLTRSPMETMRRLGLVKPSFKHILIGIAGIFITFFYDYLWSTYTHSQQGLGYADKLSHYNEGTFTAGAQPGPAFLVASATGLCAGLGEETLIRGALQPVFGILPAAFMHGALHGQFAHAPLLIMQVFGWSAIMGIIRRYTNTTTTIITHVGFNFLSTFLIAFNP